jgi:hypothetical protein
MYNKDFKVKYFQIESELLEKVNAGEDGYAKDDIFVICEKLYRDELASVFDGPDTLTLDDNISNGIEYVLKLMGKNDDFVSLLNEISDFFMFEQSDQTSSSIEEMLNYKCNVNFIIMLAAFSFPVFHIMHKCVCSQLTKNEISPELLDILKESIIKYMNSKLPE